MNSLTPPSESEPVNSLIHFSPEWQVSSQTIKMDSVIVRHDIAPAIEIPTHKTNYHHLAYELSSNTFKAIQIGKEEYIGNFERGDLCLHPASYSASYSWETTDEVIAMAIKPDFLRDIAEQSECRNSGRIELTSIIKSRDPILGQIASSFLREMATKGIGGRLYSETLATQLAIHLLRNYSAVPLQPKQYSGGLSPSQLKIVIEYIKANLAEKIGLKDLASVAKISPSHFLRLFKQSTGLTPHQFVIQQRVELAKRLLKENKLLIIEISACCGFASPSSFAKMFRKVVGITPKAYRQQF